MSVNKIKQFIFLQLLAAFCVAAVSCNSKSSDDENEIVVTPAIVAIKNFKLQANDSIMSKLDSVFFSIDLNTGVIFNADSLPKGTDVSRLIPVITFSNTMSKAELSFLKDNKERTTVNYLTNATDSIDFTSPVTLDVTAQNGVNTFTYTIKVNVHKEVPDTLIWDELATTDLPSRFANPVDQKTIIRNNTVYCLVEENNGEYTLSTSSDLNVGLWEKMAFDPGFYPEIESFSATETAFYLTNVNGNLFTSPDGNTWSNTGEIWISVIGSYNNSVLGIKRVDQQLFHTQYPLSSAFEEIPVTDDFPVENFSSLGMIETKWADYPMAILAGGMSEQGVSNKVWAFDGKIWTVLNDSTLPALEFPMLVRYVVYRKTFQLFMERKFDVWLLFGGLKEDGDINNLVYMSYNNGVSWSVAPKGMQMPEDFPALVGADAIVADYQLSADLSEAWTKSTSMETRSGYTIEGYDIQWMCPYLYIFGGNGLYPDNAFNTKIYRGVLNRLRFTPDI